MEAILVDRFVPNTSELRVSRIALPAPSKHGNAVVIRTTHVSVSHVDLLYFQGKHQNNQRHAKPPFVLGTDFAGTIIRAPSSSGFKVGEHVFGSARGAFAEYVTVEAGTEGTTQRIPRGWNSAGACAVGVSGSVSYGALVTAGGLRRGSKETVLVLGAAGGLGVIAVQIAKGMGARVIAVCNTAGDQRKAKMLKQIGADAVVGYQDENWEKQVRKATLNGEGVDLVYDSVGAVLSSIKCCRFGGRVVIVGFAGREGKMEELRVNRILLKNINVVGFRFGEYSRRYPLEAKKIWDGFMHMVDVGEIRPVVFDEPYKGLKDIPRALKDLQQRKAWGRSVVQVANADETSSGSRL